MPTPGGVHSGKTVIAPLKPSAALRDDPQVHRAVLHERHLRLDDLDRVRRRLGDRDRGAVGVVPHVRRVVRSPTLKTASNAGLRRHLDLRVGVRRGDGREEPADRRVGLRLEDDRDDVQAGVHRARRSSVTPGGSFSSPIDERPAEVGAAGDERASRSGRPSAPRSSAGPGSRGCCRPRAECVVVDARLNRRDLDAVEVVRAALLQVVA